MSMHGHILGPGEVLARSQHAHVAQSSGAPARMQTRPRACRRGVVLATSALAAPIPTWACTARPGG